MASKELSRQSFVVLRPTPSVGTREARWNRLRELCRSWRKSLAYLWITSGETKKILYDVHKCTSKSLATCTMVCVQVAFLAFFQTCAPPVARHRGGFNIGSFLFVVGGATLPITSAHYDASSVRLRGGRPDRKVKYHNWSLLARGGVYFVLTAENRTAPFWRK